MRLNVGLGVAAAVLAVASGAAADDHEATVGEATFTLPAGWKYVRTSEDAQLFRPPWTSSTHPEMWVSAIAVARSADTARSARERVAELKKKAAKVTTDKELSPGGKHRVAIVSYRVDDSHVETRCAAWADGAKAFVFFQGMGEVADPKAVADFENMCASVALAPR